jgi:DNA polymerase-3 subunit delta'
VDTIAHVLACLEAHPDARAALAPTLSGEQAPSHAYLFHGAGGVGKRESARAVAAEWLAAGSADPASARARALAGAHPDLTWVAPSGAHEVLVSDIDAPVVAAASRTPFESARRVFVVEAADRMGDEAANRMLKTLEEPAPYVHLILIAERLGEVLPTIRSRCQIVRFDSPDPELLAAELREGGLEADLARACARLGLGDSGHSRELATPEGGALRDAAEELVSAVLEGRASAQGSWKGLLAAVRARGERVCEELEARKQADLELVARRERKRVEADWAERIRRVRRRTETRALDLGLELVSIWLLDLIAIAVGAEEHVRNVDRHSQLERHAGRSVASLRSAVELVEETRQRFQLNVGEELACEALSHRLERQLAG